MKTPLGTIDTVTSNRKSCLSWFRKIHSCKYLLKHYTTDTDTGV
jgi:hypothetical protein